MAGKVFDPLEGVDTDTSREVLMERLRRAAAGLRGQDRGNKAKLQEIEDRLRAKGAVKHEQLQQVIVSATNAEWNESIEFLEEFEDLLPVGLQRLVVGGRVLLGQHEAAG